MEQGSASMKDHIETEEERRIRQYEALSPEQKAMIFQKISASFETDTPVADVKKLAEKTLSAAERAKKPSTKIERLTEGCKKLSQARDEATILFRQLMLAGESPEPELFWFYFDEVTVQMNHLLLSKQEVESRAARDKEKLVDSAPLSGDAQGATPQLPVSEYMDIDEAVRYSKLSYSTLYHDKSIPCYKVGEKLLFPKDEFDAWLRSRPRKRKAT